MNRTEEYHLYSKYTLDISDPRKSYFLTQVGYDLSYSRYTKLNCESESLEFRYFAGQSLAKLIKSLPISFHPAISATN